MPTHVTIRSGCINLTRPTQRSTPKMTYSAVMSWPSNYSMRIVNKFFKDMLRRNIQAYVLKAICIQTVWGRPSNACIFTTSAKPFHMRVLGMIGNFLRTFCTPTRNGSQFSKAKGHRSNFHMSLRNPMLEWETSSI